MKNLLFWIKMFFCHPIATTKVHWHSFVSKFKSNKWIVVPEVDTETGNITRRSIWSEPSGFDTALRRAQTENFKFVYCVEGKDEGLAIQNPQWQPSVA